MSDSSRHSLHAVPEVTYGTTPANPAFVAVRHTGTNLALSKSTAISEELRPDRQIADFRHMNRQTGGDIMGELSYGSYDSFLEAVLLGTWAAKAAPYTAGTISAAASDNSINDSANGLPLLTAGDKVTIAGFTGTVGNNRAKAVVVSSTASKLVISGGAALVDDAAGEAVTITTLTEVLKAGVTRRSFSMLRHFGDLLEAANPFHLFTGVELNKFSLTVAANAIVKVVFGTIGKDFGAPAGTAPAGTTYTAANTNAPIDSFSGSIYEGGSEIAIVTELSATLENGIEPRFVVGSATTIKPSIGRSNANGQVTAYFEDSALLNKFRNETESSLRFTLGDLAGNALRITFPRIKYNGGQPDTQGQGAITLALPIQLLYDSATGSNILVERIAA